MKPILILVFIAPVIYYNPQVLAWLSPPTRISLVSIGMLAPRDVQAIQMDIARFGRGDWSHLPGPQRAVNLLACLT
jgi:hypothetical protein